MELRRRAKDVLQCHLCESPDPPMYCDICQTHLCKPCVGEHISDESKKHKVGVFKKQEKQGSRAKYRKCSPNEHEVETSIIESQRQVIEKDLQELEKCILPRYQVMASNFPIQKEELQKNSQKLKNAIDKRRENLNLILTTIYLRLKFNLRKMDAIILGALNRQEEENNKAISGITTNIENMKKILNSNDERLFSTYISKNSEFKNVPPMLNISLPKFTHHQIEEELFEEFGSLSSFKFSYRVDSPWAESSLQYRPLIKEPRVIKQMDTEYGDTNLLHTLSCMSSHNDEDTRIWTCGDDDKLRLYDLRGELVKSVPTKSGNRPWDVAVTKSGDLLYTDYKEKTVNIVKNSQIQTVVRLPRAWEPVALCVSSTGDLLALLDCDDKDETKVVRYAGSSEIQSIQYNSIDGEPLYPYTACHTHICENRNLDICVSNCGSGTVVVVNQAGKLRFTYTGTPSTIEEPYMTWFNPYGIATDSHSRILVADCSSRNHPYRIHILDPDGQFLRFIDNCQLQGQMSLSVDKNDNLYVAEWESGKIKKIKYC